MRLISFILGLVVVYSALGLGLRHLRTSRRSVIGTPLCAQGASNQYLISNVEESRAVEGLQEGMKMRKLPGTDLVVSELCLGTMMMGEQISKADSIEQMDKAAGEYGINFIDTAESYPVPSAPSSQGRSEEFVGEWLKQGGSSRRQNTVIATKVCGFSDEITWCRKNGQGTRVTEEQVMEAVDASLKRLGTDYIDLLQIHWPDRYVPLFGAPEYRYDLERTDSTPIKTQLEIMDKLIKSGKVRHFGLSNETPYGLTEFAKTAELLGLPKPVTTQNVYNLLVRNDFETGMMEACSPANGNVGLLAYSPLAGGALTGKYRKALRHDLNIDEHRLTKYVGFMHRYLADPTSDAIEAYCDAAEAIGLPLGPLSIAFVASRPFTTSTIIGCSNLQQLEEAVLSLNIPISDEVYTLLDDVKKKHPDPTKGVFSVMDPTKEYVDPSKLPWGAKDVDIDPELDLLISERLNKF